ncbi:hypothetical protein ACIBF6_42500 [Streptosporangium amethystogenes]|uniref:hypothetical protein n=1 Tax=Streptosporangium amethystogenes TaxID=2002 RepID=UPI00379434F9
MNGSAAAKALVVGDGPDIREPPSQALRPGGRLRRADRRSRDVRVRGVPRRGPGHVAPGFAP